MAARPLSPERPPRVILGVSAFYHDSAAALVVDGRVVAAAQEERFTRIKNDERFPTRAVASCLAQAGLAPATIDAVAFYEKPVLKFARLLETTVAIAPRGFRSFSDHVPAWLRGRLNVPAAVRRELPGLRPGVPVSFTSHHQAHAASAFFPSGHRTAAILTVDGVGEWTTTLLARGDGDTITPLEDLRFPHSLGLLYSAFTAYCGFRVNSGEYKLMGLAPYGEPRFASLIRTHLVEVREDGSFALNMDYFDFLTGPRMTHERFHELFGGPPRASDGPIEPRHLDLARSIQLVTEDIMLGLARRAHERTGESVLCLAGGVALNCVANGRLLREGPFDHLWIQPAAGDAGGALGAALALWHDRRVEGDQRSAAARPSTHAVLPDAMAGAVLGPSFSPEAIALSLHQAGVTASHCGDDGALVDRAAHWLAQGEPLAWFQGRMEFGPRALGHRSILADPRPPDMQSRLNQRVKFRESFRPFAPLVLAGRAAEWFELDVPSPYMLLTARVAHAHRRPPGPVGTGLARLGVPHSTIPAVTHVDGSARVQTVADDSSPLLAGLLRRFDTLTGCPVLVNTSFNVRGEPVVATPEDALRCFARTQLEAMALGPFWILRSAQSPEVIARLAKSGPPADPRDQIPRRTALLHATSSSVALALGLAVLAARGLWPDRWPEWLIVVPGALHLAAAWLVSGYAEAAYRTAHRLAAPLGRGVSRAALAVLFGLVVVPLAWWRRRGGNPGPLAPPREHPDTFWRAAPPFTDLDRMF